jgi:hypothetical protein
MEQVYIYLNLEIKNNLNSEQISLKIGIVFEIIFSFFGFILALILIFKEENHQSDHNIDLESNSDKSKEN